MRLQNKSILFILATLSAYIFIRNTILLLHSIKPRDWEKYSTNLRLIVLIHSTFFRERYQFALGRCYALGRGVVRDANEAFKWYHRAAMGRCAEALYEVAQCYLTGEGTNYDPKESIYWMHQAADQGIPQAQYVIGRCY